MAEITYEALLERYLKSFGDDMDTREGSLAYIVGSASALATKMLRDEADEYVRNSYVQTAEGEWLDKLVALLGLERRPKTKAVVKITGEGLMVGDTVTTEDISYLVTEVYDGYALAECTAAGTIGNSYLGEVVPIGRSDITDSLVIASVVAKGEDEEDDERLRARFYERANCPVCTGNVSYYKELVDSLPGIGGRRIVPVCSGAGTVGVVITDTDYNVAGDELVSYVKEQLDPSDSEGLGYGRVPLGHKVEVRSVEVVDVDIVVEASGSVTLAALCKRAREALPGIFKEINKTWDQREKIVLWDRVIEDCFIALGAEDVNVVSINGSPNRLILSPEQILGGVTINGT